MMCLGARLTFHHKLVVFFSPLAFTSAWAVAFRVIFPCPHNISRFMFIFLLLFSIFCCCQSFFSVHLFLALLPVASFAAGWTFLGRVWCDWFELLAKVELFSRSFYFFITAWNLFDIFYRYILVCLLYVRKNPSPRYSIYVIVIVRRVYKLNYKSLLTTACRIEVIGRKPQLSLFFITISHCMRSNSVLPLCFQKPRPPISKLNLLFMEITVFDTACTFFMRSEGSLIDISHLTRLYAQNVTVAWHMWADQFFCTNRSLLSWPRASAEEDAVGLKDLVWHWGGGWEGLCLQICHPRNMLSLSLIMTGCFSHVILEQKAGRVEGMW